MTPNVDTQSVATPGGSPVIPNAWTVIAQRTIGSNEWNGLPRQMTVDQAMLANAAGRLRFRHRHAGRTEFLEIMAWGNS